MNIQEIQDQVHNRLAVRKPIFEARWPTREVEMEVLSHFGRAFMDLLVEERGIEPGRVRAFTLDRIRQIDPDLRADLVVDRDDKELHATLLLGMDEIGENFPDLLFPILQAEWDRIDQEEIS